LRRDAKSGTNPGGNGIGGGNEGVGAEVDIEHTALGAFCQNFFALPERLVDVVFAVYHRQGAEGFEAIEPFAFGAFDVERDFGVNFQ